MGYSAPSTSVLPTVRPAAGSLQEWAELAELAKAVPQPKDVMAFDQLTPRVICQQFRANTPVTTGLLFACFDPDAKMLFKAKALGACHVISCLPCSPCLPASGAA
jgi:hypothetical protein